MACQSKTTNESISDSQAAVSSGNFQLLSNENFTFTHNGSFLQLDAGREWPFNSKREISFRFKTKSPHGLLLYQTFDHNKLIREDDQENLDLIPIPSKQAKQPGDGPLQQAIATRHQKRQIERLDQAPLAQLSNTITATASERLVNSLFSASPASAINGNNNRPTVRVATVSASNILASSKEPIPASARNHRVALSNADQLSNRYSSRNHLDINDGSTVLSSSTINSLSASLYELYLKLENGRLKIMYEFGSRLNQTYCGKGLNDDRWHRVELKVDPELNQMILILDQMITVEIALSRQQEEDENMRRNELVFTNSILYLGGLDNNASIVKNVKQRLYMAQFIGCIGQIMLKTDQQTESTLQPAPIDKLVLVKRGCINKCETDNYCLHKSTCVNYYTNTKCDCFGTNYEDVYCWQDQLTTLSMLGHSTLIYRIYDWRDRHHSALNRLSLQFKTSALDSILFFAYGDLSAQQNLRNLINTNPPQGPSSPSNAQSQPPLVSMSQVSIPQLLSINRPNMHHSPLGNNNYLAISLSNGTIVVEVNFGDQPVLLSNLLYDKVYNKTAHPPGSTETSPTSNHYRPLSLSDGRWHNVTFVHNNKQLSLYLDNYSINYTIMGKNSHLYFDPSIYIGAVPPLLLNETRLLMRPFNLRHKFVGCLRSVYFNQHNILLALKQGSPMVEHRDLLGKPQLNTCLVQEPSSLPLTMRSGKSYLTFQLTPNSQSQNAPLIDSQQALIDSANQSSRLPMKKLTRIEFEYKTSLKSHFLAGGHLRDLSYHDLGGFWTMHAREDCQLYFTISSGLTFEPEQIIKLNAIDSSCDPKSWYKVSISIISGDKVLNVTRTKVSTVLKFEDEYFNDSNIGQTMHESYILKSSVELLHQVQLGGDLAKFGESSSVPFAGCMRKININGHLFDSRDFVTNSASLSPLSLSQYSNTSTSGLSATTQSDLISSRFAQGYVTLDSCQLVIPCASLNPCKNNGTCKINELGEPDCDCSKTGYTGKRCQFSIYKQSCQDLYLSGQRKSSHYLIDLDRNGPLKPIRVRCNMDEGSNHIETVLTHNLPAEYQIRRSSTRDTVLDITYLAFHHMYTSDGFYVHEDSDEQSRINQDVMLRSLIGHSLYCRQYFKYECRSAPLELGNKTWMEAPFPKTHRLTSLDGLNHGKCMCATTEKKCLNPNKNCNCDSGESTWTDDSYDLIGHEDVGLTRIVILKQDPIEEKIQGKQSAFSLESHSRFTLSDLKCYGTKQQESQREITFKTSDAYIEVPGWRRGDISFSFRTASNPPAIILYQLATSRNHGYFRLTLISDTRLLFEYIVNRRPKKLYLISTHKLNNGEWQQVFIEYDSVNLRLTVNDDSALVDLDTNDYLGTFEGPLFIGGAPSKYLIGDLSKRNGFTGCFRGLNIAGRSIDLKSYLSPSMPTVTSGCRPSCTKNLCQNGGKCIEYWGSYECECSNPIAHSGSNCEINLNTNSITFVTQESYYVQLSNDSLLYPWNLVKNILLNIRTYQETALILYASDHLNNFIQLHKNGSSLVLTFNSNSTIIITQVPIEDELAGPSGQSIENSNLLMASASNEPQQVTNSSRPQVVGRPSTANSSYSLMDSSIRVSNTSGSGQPIQVKIERHRLRTTFYVNNNFVVVEKPMIFLTNYTQNPWSNPELESVRPPRPKMGSKTYSQIFLANIDEYFTTRLPGFTGCIQGLSIDNQLFDFNRAHLTGELKGEYRIGCKMHCDSFPCKNQGTCIENWKEDRIQCKCDSTSYVGRLCDEDIAAIFNGHSSYFQYHLSKKFQHKLPAQQGTRYNGNMTNLQPLMPSSLDGEQPSTPESAYRLIDIGDMSNFFEINFAFSTDANQNSSDKHKTSVQVLIYITRANSSKHFFLGLTSDGSLLIQEDYGNSMALSRLIKRPEQPYNDGQRHMVKYSRYNQTIQIMVDYQTYLPTMSVITANHVSRYSKTSLILVGTMVDDARLDSNYTNYSGCISNLVIKMDDIVIEPLSEAFGQNLETVNINITRGEESDKKADLSLSNESISQNGYTLRSATKLDEQKTLSIINKLNGQEAIDDMETIVAKDVEQGKCAFFKRVEVVNEKRSINEPRYTPLLEPRPVYMDPPRIKTYMSNEITREKNRTLRGFHGLFYCSLFVLTLMSSSALVYAYILQVRYKSEKFRCETPFFHKRDETPVTNNQD